LSKILISVRQMTSLITEISGWSHEQSQGVMRMNEAILHLDGATQQNAALVEQGSAASRTLQDQADALSRRASFFRLEEKFGYRKADRAPATSPATAPVTPAEGMSAVVPMRKAG
jgi:methyl-accepting chemotaxis protein